MGKYALKRLGEMIPLLFLVSVAAFALVRVMPGDAAEAYLNSINAPVTEEALRKVREDLGLEGPLWLQYVRWLGQVLRLDLGVSYMTKKPVLDQLMGSFRYTMLLTGAAALWILALSLPLGVLAGKRSGGIWDQLIRGLTFLGSSLPSFWLGFLFVELFALKWKLLPVQGAETWRHLILPSATLACSYIAMYTKLVRNGIVENKGKRYAVYGKARGLTERRILWRHVLPNSLTPVLTTFGLSLGGMLSGAVIVENVFAWPGMGRLIVSAVSGRDYPMIQGYILIIAAVFTVLNLGVDLLCAAADPRIRLEGERT